ncbi:glycosyltransferase family 2 protein [Aquirufa aurantiipilula]|uniref:glycosyltransferase family 2 protein n=1 Tax=Aquirufa aurantiipilula TaxID=2696561 RepID=UPI001CAA67B5|nr:glycosyltransferase family 2 protein [Aquirufa aurantiipilula]MBZ1325792.1 glycosyltransferase family 2 protein [Aquirufa aurantiipilula]
MSVAIVILNFNGKHFLEKFLPSVIASCPVGSIYVADNGSSDDSVDFLKNHFPEVHILLGEGNLGYAGGYNRALKSIQADYFVLMNSDIEPSENWLNPLIDYMESNTQIAAVQPFILDYQNPSHFEYAGAAGGYWDQLGFPFCRGRIFDTLEKNNGQYKTSLVNWATGACLLVRADLYWLVGGLDDYFFAHMEEIDLCWRFQRAGYQVAAVAESTVKHVGGGTLDKANPFKTYLNFRNNLILLYKNQSGLKKYVIILLRMAADGLAGIKYLTSGELSLIWAILKAHFSFYYYVLFQHPKQNLATELVRRTDINSYSKSIIWDYFIQKKKKFTDLKF